MKKHLISNWRFQYEFNTECPGSTDVFHELLLIRETGKRTISKNVSQMTGDKGISPFSEILSEACGKTGDVRHQTI